MCANPIPREPYLNGKSLSIFLGAQWDGFRGLHPHYQPKCQSGSASVASTTATRGVTPATSVAPPDISLMGRHPYGSSPTGARTSSPHSSPKTSRRSWGEGLRKWLQGSSGASTWILGFFVEMSFKYIFEFSRG